jgi:DNA-binding response OmpR family regulator
MTAAAEGIHPMTSLPRPSEQQTEHDIPPLRAGGVELRVIAHTVTVQSHPTTLSPQEFRLLTMLLQHLDRVLSSQYLLDQLWSPDYTGDPGTLNVHILRLRTKLDRPHPGTSAHIRTVRGIGYIFDSTPQPSDS